MLYIFQKLRFYDLVKIFKPNIIYQLAFLIIFLPFSFSDLDEFKAIEINKENIGYYQSTTCKISLSEFIFKKILI